MVAVKVIPEKGVEYKVWNKNDKHRVYFTVNNGSGKPTEVGNYDIGTGKFYPQKGTNIVWNVVEKDDNPQALIIIGDSKQVFVGKSANTTVAPQRAAYNGGSNNNNRDRDIKRGMCFNNATHLVANNPAYHAMNDGDVVVEIMNLTDLLFAEYMKRYGN